MNTKTFLAVALLVFAPLQARADAPNWLCKTLHPLEKDRCDPIRSVGNTAADIVMSTNASSQKKWHQWQKDLYGEAIVVIGSPLFPKGKHPERCKDAAESTLNELLGKPAKVSEVAKLLALGIALGSVAAQATQQGSCQLAINDKAFKGELLGTSADEQDQAIIEYCTGRNWNGAKKFDVREPNFIKFHQKLNDLLRESLKLGECGT